MVPRLGKQGRSFKGAAAYYLHDKGASTSNRVAFTHTENLPTDDPERAFDWMAYTAMDAENIKREAGVKRTGGPAEKPVFTLSLSWHPEQEPTQEHMIDAANSALDMLGLKKHQAVMVGHNDEEHPHIHVILNLTDPETGRSTPLPFTKEKMSKWAEAYEREHGKIYCEQRVQNNAKRNKAKEQDNEEFPRYKDPEIDHKALVSGLYHASDSGKAFQAALSEHGFRLAQGKKIVIIDASGKSHSIARWIEGAREKDVRAKLSDITLLAASEVQSQQQGGAEKSESKEAAAETKDQEKLGKPAHEEFYFDRDEQDRQWQESIIDAGIKADRKSRATNVSGGQKEETQDSTNRRANQIQSRQLEELGSFYNENADARANLNAELEGAYGKDEHRLRHEISDREDGLKNASRFRRALMHLTGRFARTQREITERTLSLQNIEWRKLERTNALEKQIEENRQRIMARHQQERGPKPTAQNQLKDFEKRQSSALAEDFNARLTQDPDTDYEARRAAFMGTDTSPNDEILFTPPVMPLPMDAAAATLAQEFEQAAGYEMRRAAFMEGAGHHTQKLGPSNEGAPSQSPAPGND